MKALGLVEYAALTVAMLIVGYYTLPLFAAQALAPVEAVTRLLAR